MAPKWDDTENGMSSGRRFVISAAFVILCVLAVSCDAPALPTPTYEVTIQVDHTQQRLATSAKTVGGVLAEAGITLGPLDRVTPPETTSTSDGLNVTVTRVVQHTEIVTSTLPFKREVVQDAAVPEGVSRLLQSGTSGILEKTYKVTVEDGEEVDRLLVAESVVKPPQDEVRLLGSRPELQTVTISGTLAYLANQDAWIMRDNNLERRRLTHFGDLDGRVFALSHDGSQLLFTRAVSETDGLNELWTVRTTEASPNSVPIRVNDVLWADWAPNSRRLAWSSAEAIAEAPGWRGLNDLWSGELTEKNTLVNRRQLLEPEAGGGYGWWGTRYVWGSDGTRLAYSRPESVGVVDLDTGERIPLLEFPAYRSYSSWTWNPSLSWTPDGDFMALTVHRPSADGNDPEESPVFNLSILSVTGTYSAQLALETGMWAAPRFSPDGNRILYGRAQVPYQSATSLYTLHMIDRDGSNQVSIHPDEPDAMETPQWFWSPDGRAIVYVRHGDIYWSPLSTGAAVPLTNENNVQQVVWR